MTLHRNCSTVIIIPQLSTATINNYHQACKENLLKSWKMNLCFSNINNVLVRIWKFNEYKHHFSVYLMIIAGHKGIENLRKYFWNKLCIWWKQILMNWCYITMNKHFIVKSFDIETVISTQAMYLLADYFIDWKAFMYHT